MTRTAVRRLAAAVPLAGAVGLLTVATAGPASADTPEGWPDEPAIDMLEALLLFGGLPLLVLIIITALIMGPSLARGEGLPGADETPEDQWLGGPRKAAGELAAPDSEGSKAGGASGSW